MEKNPYTMAKLGLENKAMLHPQRDCGFYAKYTFLFLSLIQFLIILGLVLFMVYGNDRAATEKHLQGMSLWLQECRIQTGALAKEKANLTGLLNASRSESRQITGQLRHLNITSRGCTADKLKLQELLRQAESKIQIFQKYYDIANYFNATCSGQAENSGSPCRVTGLRKDKVSALQAQLKVQAFEADLEKKKLEQETQRLQAQVKKAEQDAAACQQEVLQCRTQVRKVGELEGQVRSEMQAASQSVKAAVEKALPSQAIWICNTEEVRNLQTTCNNLSRQLDSYMAALGQRLEDSVNAVARENALLQKEKAACSRDRQELDNKLTAQEQQATQERTTLQLACSTEKAKIYADQQKLLAEKENLRQELDRINQKCWAAPLPNPAMRVPGVSGGTNPIANFPGNFNPIFPRGEPNTFNPPWPRTGALLAPPRTVGDMGPHGSLPARRNSAPLGNIGSHRTSSHTGHAKLEEGKKPTGADAISPYQPSLKPAGQPRS